MALHIKPIRKFGITYYVPIVARIDVSFYIKLWKKYDSEKHYDLIMDLLSELDGDANIDGKYLNIYFESNAQYAQAMAISYRNNIIQKVRSLIHNDTYNHEKTKNDLKLNIKNDVRIYHTDI